MATWATATAWARVKPLHLQRLLRQRRAQPRRLRHLLPRRLRHLLVFRRLLLSATPTTLPLAGVSPRSAAVSQQWIPIIRTAVAPLLQEPVQIPASVLPGSSAYRAGTITSVLWRARRDD